MKKILSLLITFFFTLTIGAQNYEIVKIGIINGKVPLKANGGTALHVGDKISGFQAVKWPTKSSWLKVFDHKNRGFLFFSQNGVSSKNKSATFFNNGRLSSRSIAEDIINPTNSIENKERKEGDKSYLNEDYKSALKWYKKGAKRGDAVCMRYIAFMCLRGLGVEQNNILADEWFLKGANCGDACCMYNIGVSYMFGEGVKQDSLKAIAWYKKAAANNNAAAMGLLGSCYHDGYGVNKNLSEALKWCKKGAEKGDGQSMFTIAYMYWFGEKVEKNISEAFHWFKRGSERNDPQCLRSLGMMYLKGICVSPDTVKAVELIRKSAECGNPEAMETMGYLYNYGISVEMNIEQALEWYTIAVANGNESSIKKIDKIRSPHISKKDSTSYFVSMGDKFYNGYVKSNYSEAVKWFTKAADCGNSYSMEKLGYMYEQGHVSGSQDLEKALYWYRKGAEYGNTECLCSLGYMYELGEGVKFNYEKALELYLEGAKKGNAHCMGRLAYLYHILNNDSLAIKWALKGADLEDGNSMTYLGTHYLIKENNYKEALKWLKKGAEKNMENAMANLGALYLETKEYGKAMEWLRKAAMTGSWDGIGGIGYIYENGLGVEKNISKAIEWYRLARKHNQLSINRLNSLNSKLSLKDKPHQVLIGTTGDPDENNFEIRIGISTESKLRNVKLTINGEECDDYWRVTYDASGYNAIYSWNLPLKFGKNEIITTATNDFGSSSIRYDIEREKNLTKKNIEKRMALVIGNSAYKSSGFLRNTLNDANEISYKLQKNGFNVIKLLDASKHDMEEAIKKYGNELKPNDIALFYYAGHGICTDGVNNYLVPIDVDIPDETSVKGNCINVSKILKIISPCKKKIVILDACRNNPFANEWNNELAKGGLSSMSGTPNLAGAIIGFATSAGCVASDGTSIEQNSPYTAAILKTMDKPNLSLMDFFQEVHDVVQKETNGLQNPSITSSFSGKFYFNMEQNKK